MKKEKFIQELKHLKNAGYPIIVIQTHEEQRLENILSENLKDQILIWDLSDGLYTIKGNEINSKLKNPIEVIKQIENLEDRSIIILKDMHKLLEDLSITRTLKNYIPIAKEKIISFIFPMPTVNIPTEIEKETIVIDMPLPDEDEIEHIAKTLIEGNYLNLKVNKEILKTAKGLTASEIENSLALSIVKTKEINRKIIENQKIQIIKKTKLLEVSNPIDLEEIGGLYNLKEYIKSRKIAFKKDDLPAPKGILITGIPGTGKSLSAKAISSILEMPLVKLDLSSIKSSYVGESERNLKEALKIIDSISPVVIWIDEIEKVLGGTLSSNYTDGGTMSSMLGILLTWMQESKEKNFIVATANDVEELMKISQGALIRRFDKIFFVDVPTLEERKEILQIMNKKYKTKIDLQIANEMINWTGAEIEKFVIASIYDGVEKALKSIRPIYLQNKENIEKMRDWAKSNALIANKYPENKQSKIRKIMV